MYIPFIVFVFPWKVPLNLFVLVPIGVHSSFFKSISLINSIVFPSKLSPLFTLSLNFLSPSVVCISILFAVSTISLGIFSPELPSSVAIPI